MTTEKLEAASFKIFPVVDAWRLFLKEQNWPVIDFSLPCPTIKGCHFSNLKANDCGSVRTESPGKGRRCSKRQIKKKTLIESHSVWMTLL